MEKMQRAERLRGSPTHPARFNPSPQGKEENRMEDSNLQPPSLQNPFPSTHPRPALPPFSLPQPPPLAPGIGVTSVLGTRTLGTRWFPPMVSFVSPSRYPSSPGCPPSPPALEVGRGKGGTSLSLGTLPRPQNSRSSWPWGTVRKVGKTEGGGGGERMGTQRRGQSWVGGIGKWKRRNRQEAAR